MASPVRFPADDVRADTYRRRLAIGFPHRREAWVRAPAPVRAGCLSILGHPVMEVWEAPYMRRLASVAAARGGVVLEVGFGLGISASHVQRHPGVQRHIILEANATVFERLRRFSLRARVPTEPRFGFWEDLVPAHPSESVDGILFDTYPLTPAEVHRNHLGFVEHAFRLLRPGGVFTYYSDEVRELSQAHVSALRATGFREVRAEICEVRPPADCAYWRSNTIAVPIVTK